MTNQRKALIKRKKNAIQWQIGIDSDGLLLRVYDIMKAMSLTLVAFLICDLNNGI